MGRDDRHTQTVLVVGEIEPIRRALDLKLLGRADVKHVVSPASSGTTQADVVVVAAMYSAAELRRIREDPALSRAPVVVLDHMRSLGASEQDGSTWLVMGDGPGIVDELAERVSWLLARVAHPSGRIHARSTAA